MIENKLMKEIETLSNNNLLLRASLKEQEHRFDKLLLAFNDLLDVHLELRAKNGFEEFNDGSKYEWIDRAGLTDSY